ncbi:hypothetical protein Y1Q_0013575 [Alligator mississippiensis]|uniref:Uncharacterized protein n=1 Tax=Alligator mississippiensis TaxID=8496 RepID=A0A151P3E2_ALLMI|nr:hypothetical protein Y1Q_0013575 [Alligator mississippiensis]
MSQIPFYKAGSHPGVGGLDAGLDRLPALCRGSPGTGETQQPRRALEGASRAGHLLRHRVTVHFQHQPAPSLKLILNDLPKDIQGKNSLCCVCLSCFQTCLLLSCLAYRVQDLKMQKNDKCSDISLSAFFWWLPKELSCWIPDWTGCLFLMIVFSCIL